MKIRSSSSVLSILLLLLVVALTVKAQELKLPKNNNNQLDNGCQHFNVRRRLQAIGGGQQPVPVEDTTDESDGDGADADGDGDDSEMSGFDQLVAWFQEKYEPLQPWVDGGYRVYNAFSTIFDAVRAITDLLGGGGGGGGGRARARE